MHRSMSEVEASIATAKYAWRAGALDEAMAACRAAVEAAPTRADAAALFGLIEARGGSVEAALPWLARAAALDPSQVQVYESLGQVALAGERHDVAAIALGLALVLGSVRAQTYARYGAALAALDRHQAAVEALAAAAAREPENWTHQYLLGQSLLKLDHGETAVDAFAAAARLKPESWLVHAQLGAALVHVGRHEAALAPLQEARRLRPADGQLAFRIASAQAQLGRLAEAVESAVAAVQINPGDADAQYLLGAVLFRLGRSRDALGPLQSAVKLRPMDAQFLQVLASAQLELGQAGDALGSWTDAVRHGRPQMVRKKNFYFCQRLFHEIGAASGLSPAMAGAIALYEAMRPVPSDPLGGRPETRGFLARIAAGAPATPFDHGIAALAGGDAALALRSYARAIEAGATLSVKYEQVLNSGPDTGHPAWHLMNPYFYLWIEADMAPGDRVQDLWQQMPIFATLRSSAELERYYADWLHAPNAARDALRRLIIDCDGGALRVIDLGCGYGQWLRFLAEACGVPVRNLFGCDFHPARVEAARLMLSRLPAASGREAPGIPARNLFQANLLDWDVEGFVAEHGPMDLATLFVVTGCFDDAELDRCLSRAASLGALYLVETSVSDTWDLWTGRVDSAVHFKRHGYRRISHILPGEPMPAASPGAVVLPRKYWPAHHISIFERIEPSSAGSPPG
jgi:tetratricopeptide (TPR) repeat protein